MSDLMTIAEVARILKCSDRQVGYLAQRGDLPAIRIGRLVRFRARDLEAYIDAQVSQSPAVLGRGALASGQ